MSDSLRSHGQQHARLRCPSPSLGACSNSCPSSQWCHPAISPSVVPFSSCPQSFPASGSFPLSQLFTSGGPSTGDSASASVLPVNIQGWFPLGLAISLPWKLHKLYEKTKNTTWEAPFMWTYVFNSLGKYQGVWLMSHKSMLNFIKKLPNCLHTGLYHFAFPPEMNESSCCSAF